MKGAAVKAARGRQVDKGSCVPGTGAHNVANVLRTGSGAARRSVDKGSWVPAVAAVVDVLSKGRRS